MNYSKLLAFLMLFAVLSLSGFQAQAVDYVWSGVDSVFETNTNWTPNGNPGAGDKVTFDNTTAQDCTVANAATMDELIIDSGYTGTVTLNNDLNVINLRINGATLNCGANTVTITGISTPLLIAGGANLVSSGAAFVFKGQGTTYIPALSYGSLSIQPAAAGHTHFLLAGNLAVAGTITVGDATSGVTLDLNTNDPNVSVGANVVISAAASLAASSSAAMTVTGNWSCAATGTFTHNSGTILFNATDTDNTIDSNGQSFGNITFNGTGKWKLNDALSAGSVLSLSNGEIDANQKNITVGGNFVINSGTFTHGGGTQTLIFNGAGNQNFTPGGQTFNAVTSSSTATVTLTDNVIMNSILTVTSGTMDCGARTVTLDSTGTPVSVTGGSLLTSAAVFIFKGNGATVIPAMSFGSLRIEPTADGFTHTAAAGSLVTAGNLTVGNGTNTVTLDLVSNLVTTDINGDVIIRSGATLSANGTNTFTVAGNWNNAGTYTHNSGTVAFDAADTDNTILCGGSSFADVQFSNGTGKWTLSDALSASGKITLTAGEFAAGGKNITLSGNWEGTAGTFTHGSGTQTITFNGAAPQTFQTLAQTFNNVTFSSAGSTVTSDGALNLAGTLSVTSGTLDLGTNNSPLTVGGALTLAAGTTFTASAAGLTFNGSGSGAISDGTAGQNFGKVTVDGISRTLTLGSNITALSMTVGADDTLAAGANTLTLTGTGTGASRPFILTGGTATLSAGTGTVEYTGTGATDVEPAQYFTLKVNGTAAHTLTGNTMASNIDLVGGSLDCGANTVTITGTGAVLAVGGGTTLTVSSANFLFTGNGATDIPALSFGSIRIEPSANGFTYTVPAGTLTSAGNLTVGNGTNTVTLDLISNLVTTDVNGDVIIRSGATLSANGTNGFTVAGNWNNAGTYTHNSGTVTFDAADTDNTILSGSSPFSEVVFNNGTGKWTLSDAFIAAGSVTLTAGEVAAAGKDITLGGNWSGTTGTFTHGGGTQKITFNGAAPQTFLTLAQPFNNLIFASAGSTVTTSGNLVTAGDISVNSGTLNLTTNDSVTTVGGNLTIAAGAALLASDSALLTLSGNFVNGGTFTHNSGNMEFNAADTDNTITAGGSTLGGVRFNNGAGKWTLGSDLTLAGNLLLSDGTLDLDASGNRALTVDGTVVMAAGLFEGRGGPINFNTSLTLNGGTFNSTSHTGSSGDNDGLDVDTFIIIGGGVFNGGTGYLRAEGGMNVNSGTFNASNRTVDNGGTWIQSSLQITNAATTFNGSGDLTVTGSLIVNANTVFNGPSEDMRVGGAFTVNLPATCDFSTTRLTLNSGANVDFTPGAKIFQSVDFASTGVITAKADFTATSAIISAGTMKMNHSQMTLTGTGSDTLKISAGTILEMAPTALNVAVIILSGAAPVINNQGTINVTSSAADPYVAIFKCTGGISQLVGNGVNTGAFTSYFEKIDCRAAQTVGAGGLLKLTGPCTFADVNITGGQFQANGQVLSLGGTIRDTGGAMLLDAASTLSLTADSTIVLEAGTADTFAPATLLLNDHVLTLGEAGNSVTDLTVTDAVVIDNAAEGIVSGDSDLTLTGGVTLSNGKITSTGGTISLNPAALSFSSGNLDIKGSTLNLPGDLTQSGTGTLNLTGTTLNLSGNCIFTSLSTIPSAGITTNGKSFTLGSATSGISFTNAVTLAALNIMNAGSGSLLFGGGVTLSGGDLTAAAGGTVDLGAAVTFASGQLSVPGATLILRGSLTQQAGATLSLAGSIVDLRADVNLTTLAPVSVASLLMKGHTFTLASAATDLTVANQVVLSAAGDRIITGDADLTLSAKPDFTAGLISSTGGTVTFSDSLDMSGTSSVNSSGGSVVVNPAVGGKLYMYGGAGMTLSGGAVLQTGNGGLETGSISTASLDLSGAGNSTIAGPLTLGGSGTFRSPAGTIDVRGNTDLNISVFDANGGVMDFTTNACTLLSRGKTLSNLTVTSSLLLKDNLKVAGNIVTTGTLSALDGGSSRNIELAGNWNNTGTFTTGTGTVEHTGTGTVTGGNFSNFTKSGFGTLTLASAMDVNGVLTLSSGTVAIGNNNIQLAGNLTATSSGSLSVGSGLLILDGGAVQTLTSSLDTDLKNVKISGGSTLSLGSDARMTTITSDGTGALTPGSHTLVVSGSGTPINLTAGTTFDATNSTIQFTASDATLPELTYNDLTVDQISKTYTITNAMDVNGDLTVRNGTLSLPNNAGHDVAGSLAVEGNAGAILKMAAGGTLTVHGSMNVSSAGTLDLPATTTVVLNGGGTLTPGGTSVSHTFADLQIAGGGYTLSGDLSVSGKLQIQAGSTMNFGSGKVILSGAAAAYSCGDQTLTTMNNADLIIKTNLDHIGAGKLPSGEIYGSLSLQEFSAGGTPAFQMGSIINGDWTIGAGVTVTMTEDVVVNNGTVTVNGTLNTAGYELTINSGNLVINPGAIMDATNSAPDVDVTTIAFAGDPSSFNNQGTFRAADSIVSFQGTSSDSYFNPGSSDFNSIVVNGSDGTSADKLTLSVNPLRVANLTITSGTFSASSQNVTVTANLTVNGANGAYNGGYSTTAVAGNLTTTAAGGLTLSSGITRVAGALNILVGTTFNNGNGTLEFNGSAAQTIETNGFNLYSATISNSAGVTFSDALTFGGAFTVAVDGAPVTFVDAVTFTGDFTSRVRGAALVFNAGKNYTFSGDLDLDGQSAGSLTTLRSSGAGSAYTFILSKKAYLYRIDVKDCNLDEGSGAGRPGAIAYDSLDSGGNDTDATAPETGIWVFSRTVPGVLSAAKTATAPTADSFTAGSTQTLESVFTTVTTLASGSSIVIEFPAAFDLSRVTGVTSATDVNVGSFRIEDGNRITVVLGGALAVGTVDDLRVAGVIVPVTVMADSGRYKFYTLDSSGGIVDQNLFVSSDATVQGTGGTLAGVDADFSTLKISTATEVKVSFRTVNPLPSDGRIVIGFPDAFTITGGPVTVVSSTLDGTLSGTGDNTGGSKNITITRGGAAHQVPANGALTDIAISGITNPTTTGAAPNLTLKTQTSAAVDIDTATIPGTGIGVFWSDLETGMITLYSDSGYSRELDTFRAGDTIY
ncbi:MAG: hypothetical protein CVV64_02645, partial [Candidatus Wallbacteria bacterium HGW-Wallbacteria-1]